MKAEIYYDDTNNTPGWVVRYYRGQQQNDDILEAETSEDAKTEAAELLEIEESQIAVRQ